MSVAEAALNAASPPPQELVRDAVRRARDAQGAWAALPARERARYMRGVRRVLVRRMDEVIETIRAETGKPAMEALGHEVMVVAGLIRSYERRAPEVLRPRRVGTGVAMATKRGTKLYEPYGVVGVISPWNYPFSLPAIPVVSALFAGNAVVLKPSEVTPRCGELLAELVAEGIGDYAGLVQVVQGGGDVGAALVTSGVDKIAFIGSTATGRRVLAAAAQTLTPVVLELGANDVAIVCGDADLERAAAGVVWGAMANAGQVCMSVERALVPDAIYDRFARAVEAEIDRVRTTAAGDQDVGRLIFPPQREIIQGVVDDAVAAGGRVVRGGRSRLVEGGILYEPTLILDATAGMALNREETFGPVLPLVRVRDEDEAVRLANDGAFGLNASVWTASPERGRRIARRLRAGMVMVNDAIVNFAIPELPYGGVRQSGFGRMMGDEGLLEFSQVKSVAETLVALPRELTWFPYRPAVFTLLRRATRVLFG